ncbi:MAG TPA: hypothetical protein VF219_11785 [Vicinamibacterales bacterium]
MKRLLAVVAAVLAAAIVFIIATLPPHRLALNAVADRTVPGAMHVHTSRSDGLSSPDEVAAAAARAGLTFLIFTDHGDATRAPDPPSYRSGVLCLDGVEISTSGGHYIAIDMPPSPYPLGGEARDVVEDVARLGGFGIAAHPDSPKLELRWEDWTVPIDGVELLNLDTSWRVIAEQPGWAPKGRLLTGLLDYPFRPAESIARLIQPTTALPQWDALTRRRKLVSVGGADAHAKLARTVDPGNAQLALPLPSYESSFKVLSVRVLPDGPLSGDAARDAAIVFKAIRAGHLYTVVDGLATPPALEFTAANLAGTVGQGDRLAPGGAVTLHVRSNAPPSFVTYIRDGLRTISTVHDSQDITVHAGDAPAVYWAEIVSPGPQPITWLRSNPIYAGNPQPQPSSSDPGAPRPAGVAVFDGRTSTGWTFEHDAQSLAAVDVASTPERSELRFRFGLADGPAVGQYASLVLTVPDGVEPFEAIRFRVRAEKPMRISVQARISNADRWQRSVYAEPLAQERTVRFDDLRPVGSRDARTIPTRDLRSIMFVVDTTNTRTGTSGRIWLSDVALVRRQP